MNIKTERIIIPFVVMVPLVLGIDVFLAQSRKNQRHEDLVSQVQITEPDRETRIRNTLADLLADVGVHVGKTVPVSDAQSYQEILVRWQNSGASAQKGAARLEQPGPGVLTLVNSTRRLGTLPRERSLELSPNQVLVVAVDGNRELRWWRLLLDPRLVRSETPGVSGDISGESYYLIKVDFIIPYPDDPAIKELRFYQPLWSGKDFHLALFSTLPLG